MHDARAPVYTAVLDKNMKMKIIENHTVIFNHLDILIKNYTNKALGAHKRNAVHPMWLFMVCKCSRMPCLLAVSKAAAELFNYADESCIGLSLSQQPCVNSP